MNAETLNKLKDRLLTYIGTKESHVEYYGKYDQCETYYLYVSEVEDMIEEFFDKETRDVT